jgi:hypothetical protein
MKIRFCLGSIHFWKEVERKIFSSSQVVNMRLVIFVAEATGLTGGNREW